MLFFYADYSEMITLPSRLIEDITSHLIHTVDRVLTGSENKGSEGHLNSNRFFQVPFSVTLCSLILQGSLVPVAEALSLSAPSPSLSQPRAGRTVLPAAS